MSDLLFGKASKPKKRKNPKPTENDICAITKSKYAELHEVFYGRYRQRSIEEGLQVRLCYKYHRSQPEGVHGGNINLDRTLKVKAQMQWMLRENKTTEEFIRLFGKDYISLYEDKMRETEWWGRVNFNILPRK